MNNNIDITTKINIILLDNELWRECKFINDFDKYRDAYISSKGRLVYKSKWGRYILKDTFGKLKGYYIIVFKHSTNNSSVSHLIHSLVLEAFYTKSKEDGIWSRHLDNIKTNNDINNLGYHKDIYITRSRIPLGFYRKRIPKIPMYFSDKNIIKYKDNIFVECYINLNVANSHNKPFKTTSISIYKCLNTNKTYNGFTFKTYKEGMENYDNYLDYLKHINSNEE